MAFDPNPGRDPARDGDYGNNPDGHVWWLDRRDNVTKIVRILFAACVIVFLIDFIIHRHAEVGADGIWGFYAAFGFFGPVLLVLVAKQLRKILKRPEDYYDR